MTNKIRNDLIIGFIISHAVGNLFFLLALGDITGNIIITRIAGYEGIICGFSAIYLAAAQIINGAYKKDMLPI